jgi:transcriptional regulator with XRE-family HTH domain
MPPMKAMNGKHLGMIIRDSRKRQGLTPSQVAKMMDIKQSTISKMEMNASTTIETLFKVLNNLGLVQIKDPIYGNEPGDFEW